MIMYLLRDPHVSEVHAAPGNAGIAQDVPVHPLNAQDPEAVVALARDLAADLVVVGPEAPLVAGAADALTEAGIQTVPVMVALGAWGMSHRETSPELTIRARILADSPDLVADLIDELREVHLGTPRPDPARPRASEVLRRAFVSAVGE